MINNNIAALCLFPQNNFQDEKQQFLGEPNTFVR